MQYSFIPASHIFPQNLSFWQSKTWSDILSSSLQVREIFYYGNRENTFLLIEIRSIGLGFFGAFALGVSSHQIGHDWDEYIIDLRKILRKKGILFLQIEPIDTIPISGGDENHRIYKKFLTPYTRILDLRQTEDALLSQMHEKGRYNIRLATKRGVQVERVGLTEESLDIWMKLLSDTLSRDGFAGNSRRYYEIFIANIEQMNQGGLYFARFENRVIAAGIFVFTPSSAIYYYGASSSISEDRKQMAPYLLQWQAICEGRNRGIEIYDFLGVADPSDPEDPLRGVTDFKEKFGGKRIEFPKKIFLSLSWKYHIFLGLQKIKNLLGRR